MSRFAFRTDSTDTQAPAYSIRCVREWAVAVPALVLAIALVRYVAAAGDPTTECINRVGRLNTAVLQYAQDYDERFPTTAQPTLFKTQISPYLLNAEAEVFNCPATSREYKPNSAISNGAVSNFSEDTEIIGDAIPHADGLRITGHLDGRVLRGGVDTVPSTVACINNQKRLGQALLQYAQDYDEVLPSLLTPAVVQTALQPYTRTAVVFQCPDTGYPYFYDSSFGQRPLSQITSPSTANWVRDYPRHHNGTVTRGYIDGHVTQGDDIFWSPRTVAMGGDGITRILGTHTDGRIAIWFVDANGNLTSRIHGPATGWHGVDVAADGSATAILWRNDSGRVSLWRMTNDGNFTENQYGPFAGWTVQAVDVGPDGKRRLLWRNTDGRVSVWLVGTTGQYQTKDYGPFAGWTGIDLAAGPNNQTYLLWRNTDGRASVWNVASDLSSYATKDFGPFTDWTAKSLSVAGDGRVRLLWNNVNGKTSMWNIAPNLSTYFTNDYGPFEGWSTLDIGAGTDNRVRILWMHLDGRIGIWRMSPTDGVLEASYSYGPYDGP